MTGGEHGDQVARLWRPEVDIASFVEDSPDVIFRLDRCFRYTYMNSAIERFSGRPHEYFLGKIVSEIQIAGYDPAGLVEACREVLATCSEVHREFSFREKRYRTRIIPESESDGTVKGLLGITEDITVRERVEETLRETQHQHVALIQAIDGIVWELDYASWKFTFVSKQAEKLLGYPTEQWLQDPDFWPSRLHPEDRTWVPRVCMEASAKGEDHQFEYRMIAADGRTVWFRDIVTVEVKGGQTACLRGIMVDITASKTEEVFRAGQNRVLEMIAAGASVPDVLTALVLLIESQCDDALCSVVLLDEDGMRLRHIAAPNLPGEYNEALVGQVIGPGAGSCGSAMYYARAVVTRDIEEDTLWDDYRYLARRYGLRACWSTPIVSSKGKVLGSFAMYWREPREPAAEHHRLVAVATHIAGIAIERQLAQEALEESERRFRAIYSEAGTGMSLLDLTSRRPLESNRALQRMLGCNGDELSRLETFHELTCPDDRAHDGAVHRELREGKRQMARMEKHYKLRDGRNVWANVIFTVVPDSKAQPKYLIGMHEDITDRKIAEDALRASEERYRNVVETQADMICRCLPDTTITFVNDAYCRYYGKERNEIIGRTFLEFLPVSEKPVVLTYVNSVLTNAGSEPLEHRALKKDGTVGWLQWTTYVVRDAHGNVIELQGIGRDITGRKLAEEALKKSEKALRRSDEQIRNLAGKLMKAQEEERRRISRELHDDLGQSVAALSLFLSKVRRQLGSEAAAPVICDLEKVQNNVNQLADGIRHISHQLHPALLERAGLVAALKSFVREFGDLECVNVQLNLPKRRIAIPEEIALCLYRLAQESLHNVARHSGAKHAEITLSKSRGHARLLVRDNGRGFDPEHLDHAGGLGLVSMSERVRLLHGRFKVSTRPGKGTVISATIPFADK
jgi:PAS domain S-box-containing protein